jgi:hypothetical protein
VQVQGKGFWEDLFLWKDLFSFENISKLRKYVFRLPFLVQVFLAQMLIADE